jgi:hypothetical protein
MPLEMSFEGQQAIDALTKSTFSWPTLHEHLYKTSKLGFLLQCQKIVVQLYMGVQTCQSLIFS